MPSTESSKLMHFIHDLCQMDKYGGRCVRGPDSLQVHDVAQFTEEQASALRARFPAVTVRIVANRASLSGFSILLHRNRGGLVWTSILIAAVLIAVVAAVTKVVCEMKIIHP